MRHSVDLPRGQYSLEKRYALAVVHSVCTTRRSKSYNKAKTLLLYLAATRSMTAPGGGCASGITAGLLSIIVGTLVVVAVVLCQSSPLLLDKDPTRRCFFVAGAFFSSLRIIIIPSSSLLLLLLSGCGGGFLRRGAKSRCRNRNTPLLLLSFLMKQDKGGSCFDNLSSLPVSCLL